MSAPAPDPAERPLWAVAVLAGVAAAAAELGVPNDLFWHLAIARELMTHGFPRTDPFAFSTNAIAWSPPEWLGELAFGGAHAFLGLAGTAALALAAVAAIFALLFTTARRVASAPAAALAVVLFAWPAAVHLPMRPLVLGHLMTALLLERLSALRAGHARGVALLPLAFALWTNLHPSWPMGLAILELHALVLLVPAPFARLGLVVEPLAPEARRALAIAAAASPLAVLLRPDGLDGALYPFVHVIGLGDRMREIIEWFAPDLAQPVNLTLVLLLALALGLALRTRAEIRALDVGLVALGAVMALRYQRFLPLAAMLAAPVLARGLGASLSRLTLAPRTARAVAVGVLVLAVVSLPAPGELEESRDALLPTRAARWVHAHPLPARAFNTFEDGGLLAWALPERQVFIDSRFDLFARAGVFDDYLALRRGERVGEIVARYGIEAAIVPTATRDENFRALAAALPGLGMTRVYVDEGTEVWARRPADAAPTR
jgi:hypothetical protein